MSKYDIIGVPAVSINQSLSGDVFDDVFLVVIPHGT